MLKWVILKKNLTFKSQTAVRYFNPLGSAKCVKYSLPCPILLYKFDLPHNLIPKKSLMPDANPHWLA